MEKDINLATIKKFSKAYESDKNNKITENAIKNVGINRFCLNNDVINRTYNVFNIELPKSKIYNQKDSERCWIHAGVNLIKNNVANNLNVEESNYAISINFLAFFDKLEKSNSLYNKIIENDNFDLDKEMKQFYLALSVYEGGYFEYFRSLVKKYGIVPEHIMPDVESSTDSMQLTKLFKDKVKKDIIKLLELKHKDKAKEQLYSKKQSMLEENYSLLSKCLGEPPMTFDYEYKNKNGQTIKISNLTPLEFANKYLTINLDDFVGIANVPMYNKEYYKLYKKQYTENIFGKSDVEFLNMPIDDLKELSIKHLKDGTPVYFGCEVKKMRDRDLGIMDSELYNYKDVFGIDLLSKQEALSLYDIDYQHVMLITGVHIENDKPIRWKVEDSYGDKVHKDGYYIMNDNFFNDFVIEVIIDKKYLSKEQLELFNQKPTLFSMNEPF